MLREGNWAREGENCESDQNEPLVHTRLLNMAPKLYSYPMERVAYVSYPWIYSLNIWSITNRISEHYIKPLDSLGSYVVTVLVRSSQILPSTWGIDYGQRIKIIHSRGIPWPLSAPALLTSYFGTICLVFWHTAISWGFGLIIMTPPHPWRSSRLTETPV